MNAERKVPPIKLVHIFASVEGGAPDLLLREHISALESWVRASHKAPRHVELDIIGICFEPSADRSRMFPDITFVHSQSPTVRDLLGIDAPALPLVSNILEYVPADADRVIFSNSDIHLIDSAYEYISHQMDEESGAISINRVTLPADQLGTDLETVRKLLPTADPHPGSDLFCFPKVSLDSFVFDNVFLGSPPVAKIFMTNLSLACSSLRVIEESGVSYHFGDSREWESNSRMERLNSFYAFRALSELKIRHGRVGLRRQASRLGGRWGFLLASVDLISPRWPPTFTRLALRALEHMWRVVVFLVRLVRAILRLVPRGIRLMRRALRPSLRWFRLIRVFFKRTFQLPLKNPHVLIVSPGGVATTTLIRHVSKFVFTNDSQDKDGLKHLPNLPERFRDSQTLVIYIAASSPETAIASLRNRGMHRIQAMKLASSLSGLLTAFSAKDQTFSDALSESVTAQRKSFEELQGGHKVLIVEREALFRSATKIQRFLNIEDDSFVEDFPLDHKTGIEPLLTGN
jgi:hypothetical protein